MGFWSKLFGGEKTAQETPASEAQRASSLERKSPEAAFAQWCLTEIRKHPAVERAELGEGPSLPVSIWKRGSDGTHTMFLKNTFIETRELSPADKLAALKRLLLNLERSRENRDWHDVNDSFVPLLRAATFGAGVRGDAPPMVTRPFRCLRGKLHAVRERRDQEAHQREHHDRGRAHAAAGDGLDRARQ